MIRLAQEERLFIYAWFSSLLGQELTEQQLTEYQRDTFDSLFAVFSEQGFESTVAQLKNELNQLNRFEYPRLELAADFTQLFLLDSQSSALPYASAYLKPAQLTPHLKIMDSLLTRFTLQVNQMKNEPSDHLCVYLELLIQLISHASLQEQHDFFQQQLLPWLKEFVIKLNKIKTKTQFYQILVTLFLYFAEQDLT